MITGDASGGRAYGTFASALNNKLQGCSASPFDGGSFGSSNDFLSTPLSVSYGEAPALWSGGFMAGCFGSDLETWSTDLYVGDPTNPNGGGPENLIGTCNVPAAESFFELSGSIPSTLTVPGTGLNTKYGPPRLEVSSVKQNGAVSYTQAFSVASNGTSATFEFPPNSTGASLGTGLYGYAPHDSTASGANRLNNHSQRRGLERVLSVATCTIPFPLWEQRFPNFIPIAPPAVHCATRR